MHGYTNFYYFCIYNLFQKKGQNSKMYMDDDTFGGLYQDNVINLKIYEESAYKSNGAPMFETQVPMDEYLTFEINP